MRVEFDVKDVAYVVYLIKLIVTSLGIPYVSLGKATEDLLSQKFLLKGSGNVNLTSVYLKVIDSYVAIVCI